MTPPRRQKGAAANAELRGKEALKLHLDGLSMRDIAAHFSAKGRKVSHVTIKRDIDAALKQLNDTIVIKEPEAPTSEDVAARRDEIFDLYLSGMSYRQIAAHYVEKGIKLRLETIKQDVDARLEESRAEKLQMADKWRAREDERLHAMLLIANKQAADTTLEPNERLAAVDRVIKVGESIRKLWGLDMPIKIDVHNEAEIKAYLSESPDAWPEPPTEGSS